MERLNLNNAVAFGNDAFTRLGIAEELYEDLVERLYALGEEVASKIESPELVADALIKAAHAHCARRNGYRRAEKALMTAYRIVAKVGPTDNARIIAIYKLLGHVCCRQGKHREAMKYNALALVLQVHPQPISLLSGQ